MRCWARVQVVLGREGDDRPVCDNVVHERGLSIVWREPVLSRKAREDRVGFDERMRSEDELLAPLQTFLHLPGR